MAIGKQSKSGNQRMEDLLSCLGLIFKNGVSVT
jgi:hypothetical protein